MEEINAENYYDIIEVEIGTPVSDSTKSVKSMEVFSLAKLEHDNFYKPTLIITLGVQSTVRVTLVGRISYEINKDVILANYQSEMSFQIFKALYWQQINLIIRELNEYLTEHDLPEINYLSLEEVIEPVRNLLNTAIHN